MSLSYWNYFLALESDLERLSRYVEFNDDNFNAYSIEMVHLLLAAASEIDVVAKQNCAIIAPREKAENIKDYCAIFISSLPEIKEINISIPRYNLEFTPWSYWSCDKSPEWWTAYNNIKHQRGKYFKQANLKNVLDAISGLFVILLLLYRNQSKETKLTSIPMLFRASREIVQQAHTMDGETNLIFKD